MHRQERYAIVITHMGRRQEVVEMPWLETENRIDESDWMVLSEDDWRAVADGDPTIWEALQQKLLVGFYVNQPQLIVVIGHPAEADGEGRRAPGSGPGGTHPARWDWRRPPLFSPGMIIGTRSR